MDVDLVVLSAVWKAVCKFGGCTGFRSGTVILGVVGMDKKLYTGPVGVVSRALWRR